MTPRTRGRILQLAVLALVVASWFLLPSGFARGVLVGIVGGLGLAMGGVAVFARIIHKRIEDRLQPPPLPISSWDYALDMQDLAGTTIPMSRYSGRVLVLNFWATWCGPCLAEFPSLERLGAATADLDVTLACLTNQKAEEVRRFAEKRGLKLPFYLFDGEAPPCFHGRSIPRTFILDRAGRIVMRHVGAARWDDPDVVTFVRALASSPA